MKISEIKHNHSLTDLLKIILFSILMLAPFTSVAIRSLYVICNKNAYQSYSETQELKTDLSYLEYGKEYIVNTAYLDLRDNYTIYASEMVIYNADTTPDTILPNQFYIKSLNGTCSVQIGDLNYDDVYATVKFTFLNFDGVIGTDIQYFEELIPNSLDNVFEYSVSKLAEDQLFNWTQKTAIYSGIQAMTTQLGVTGQTIPVILTYWALLTIIYVIIDIILKCFTVLTHMLGSKKA